MFLSNIREIAMHGPCLNNYQILEAPCSENGVGGLITAVNPNFDPFVITEDMNLEILVAQIRVGFWSD